MKRIQIIIEAVLVIVFLAVGLIRGVGCGNQGASADKPYRTVPEYMQQGNKLYEEDDFAGALVMYWNALKSNPNLVEPRIKIATIYFHRNNWTDDAMAQLDKALKIEPQNAEAHFLRGKILRDGGFPQEAIKEYQLALEIDPQNAGVHYYLGVVYQANRFYEEAINEYKLAIAYDTKLVKQRFERAPYGIQARFMLARLYTRTQRVDEAIDELEKIVAADDTYQDAKTDLVNLLDLKAQSMERGGTRDYLGALEVYERIVELDPNYVDAWVEIGKIKYYGLEEPKEALEAFQKAYELDPTYLDVILLLKNLKQELGLE
jgi:tetratricopeptide (TPR) repeat protein